VLNATKNFARGRKGVFATLVGIVIFYFLALAGTFAVVWSSAEHKTEAMLDYAESDVRDTVDEVIDAVLVNVGVAIVDHLKSAHPMPFDEMRRLANAYNVDELNVISREGVIIGTNDPSVMGWDMAHDCAETAAFMVLTNDSTGVLSQKFRRSASDPSIVRKYFGVAFPKGDGYIQVGYDERRLDKSFAQMVGGLLSKWRIGETGYYISADKAYSRVVVPVPDNPEAFDKSLFDLGIDLFAIPKDEGETFEQTLFGKRCYCRHFIYGRHRLFSVVPAEEFYGPALRYVMTAGAVLLIVFFVFGYVIGHMVSQQRRIEDLRKAEDERREKDLAMAKTIQTSALPVVFPDEPDFKIFAKMVTAREVGGDFYDFYVRPDGKIVFLIADVSGKGIPAALFMMRAKAIIRASVFERPDSISTALKIANDNLADHNDAEMFVTAWVGVYDRTTGMIAYVNAGHNPPLVKRADGSVEWIRGKGGLVLAAMGGVSYRSGRCKLEKGDSLFLYTDGVSEAMSTANEQYGEARLEAALKKSSRLFVSEIGDDVAAFTVGAEQSDDITMLAFDRL